MKRSPRRRRNVPPRALAFVSALEGEGEVDVKVKGFKRYKKRVLGK